MYQNRNKIPVGQNRMEKGEKNRGGGRVKERGIEMVVNFLVRAILGAALIFFVNQFLDSQEISVAVGLNPYYLFDRWNPWPAWDCAPLWNCVLANFVRVSQRLEIYKKQLDKTEQPVYNANHKQILLFHSD